MAANGFIGCDALDQDGLDRIAGLDALVPPLVTDSAPIVEAASTRYCGLEGNVWGDGNILLGGGGSDTIEGRGADDIIDGDKYLGVRLSVRTDVNNPATEIGTTDLMSKVATSGNFGPGTTGMTLQQAVFAGLVDPGNIAIVREILDAGNQPADGHGRHCVRSRHRSAGYTIVNNPNGSVTVTRRCRCQRRRHRHVVEHGAGRSSAPTSMQTQGSAWPARHSRSAVPVASLFGNLAERLLLGQFRQDLGSAGRHVDQHWCRHS